MEEMQKELLTGYPSAPVALKVTEKQILENISYEEEKQ